MEKLRLGEVKEFINLTQKRWSHRIFLKASSVDLI